MNIEKLKLIFRCSMFAGCALMFLPTLMGAFSAFSMMAQLGSITGIGAALMVLVYSLSPWIGVAAFWSAAEVLFDMSDKLAKMDSGGRDKSVSHGSSQANWESWKKVGK